MNEQWRKEMRDKMEGYGERPPRLEWAKVERAVAERKKHTDSSGRATIWTHRAVAAAVVALIATATMKLATHDNETTTESTRQEIAGNTTGKNSGENISNNTENLLANQTTIRVDKRNNNISTTPIDSTKHAETASTDGLTYSAESSEKSESQDLSTSPTPPTKTTSPTKPKRSTIPPATPKKHALTMKAYMANNMTTKNSTSPNMLMLAAAEPIGTYDAAMSGNAEGEPLRTKTQSETTAKHSLPIRAGISLRYQLDNRWSIETGLTYTYLHSEITQRTGNTTLTTNQRLHYVGIPVGVSYKLWNNRKAGIYVTGNMAAEKCVGGTENISRLQLSAGAALGVEYYLNKNVGAYIEPGITHYFDNNSDVITTYSDRQTNLNVHIGVRFNLK